MHKTTNRREWVLFCCLFLVWIFLCIWSGGAFSSGVIQKTAFPGPQVFQGPQLNSALNPKLKVNMAMNETPNPGPKGQDIHGKYETLMRKDASRNMPNHTKLAKEKSRPKSSFFKGVFKEGGDAQGNQENQGDKNENKGRHLTTIAEDGDKTNRFPNLAAEVVEDNQFRSCGYCSDINNDIKKFSSAELLSKQGVSREEVLELDQKGRALLEEILKKNPQKLDSELLAFNKAQNQFLKKSYNGQEANHSVGQSMGQQPQLYIFISLSLHKHTLRALLEEAKRVGGVLVLRGLKDGSWQKTITLMLPILKEYEEGIILDPTLFKRFDIREVPSIVLTKADPFDQSDVARANSHEVQSSDSFDKIAGNITIDYALRLFREKGDLSAAADHLLKRSDS